MKIPADLRFTRSVARDIEMDEETKEALHSILAGGSKRAAKPSRSPFYATHPFSEAPSKPHFVAWKFNEAKEPQPARGLLRDAPIQASIKDATAILSINSAKACIVLRAAFTGEVLRKIEDLVTPSAYARWNSRDEVIELHPTLLPAVKSILNQHYAGVHVLGVQKQVKATKFDQLLAKLDASDKAAIYKLLARKYHPDMGGSKDTMILINQVFKES